jgi:hypothetical protein
MLTENVLLGRLIVVLLGALRSMNSDLLSIIDPSQKAGPAHLISGGHPYKRFLNGKFNIPCYSKYFAYDPAYDNNTGKLSA